MQIHVMVPVSLGVLRTGTISCYCEKCLAGNYHTVWVTTHLLKKTSHEETRVTESRPANTPVESQREINFTSSKDPDPVLGTDKNSTQGYLH